MALFKPGQSGNPNGRPRGARSRVTMVDLQRGIAKLGQQVADLEDEVHTFTSGGGGRIDNESSENRNEDREDR